MCLTHPIGRGWRVVENTDGKDIIYAVGLKRQFQRIALYEQYIGFFPSKVSLGGIDGRGVIQRDHSSPHSQSHIGEAPRAAAHLSLSEIR